MNCVTRIALFGVIENVSVSLRPKSVLDGSWPCEISAVGGQTVVLGFLHLPEVEVQRNNDFEHPQCEMQRNWLCFDCILHSILHSGKSVTTTKKPCNI